MHLYYPPNECRPASIIVIVSINHHHRNGYQSGALPEGIFMHSGYFIGLVSWHLQYCFRWSLIHPATEDLSSGFLTHKPPVGTPLLK